MGIEYIPESMDAIRTDSARHAINDTVNYIAEKTSKLAESIKADFGVVQSGAMEIKADFAKNLSAMREQGVSLAKSEDQRASFGMSN